MSRIRAHRDAAGERDRSAKDSTETRSTDRRGETLSATTPTLTEDAAKLRDKLVERFVHGNDRQARDRIVWRFYRSRK